MLKEIRKHKWKGYHEWILDNEAEKRNNKIALHSSLLSSPPTQPAVLDANKRTALVMPTRLYDAKDLIDKEGVHPGCYLDEWVDEALLKTRLRELAQQLGICYFWVDRWCVRQGDLNEKASEIHRMGEYYRGASACVVLLAPWAATKFECLPQQSGASYVLPNNYVSTATASRPY